MESAARQPPPPSGDDGHEHPEANGSQQQPQLKDEEENVPRTKKPGFLQRFMTKHGISAPILMMMFKGTVPPIVAISMYQSHAVSSYYVTLGYLIPIISVLALPLLPRGKFMINLTLNVLAVCLGAAISMLMLWSGVKARENTTPGVVRPSLTLTGAAYNSSQSAVCAIWLFFNIWAANVVRAKLPAFNMPVIIYSILVNVSATYGPWMTVTKEAELFVRQLLTCMLVALALALGANLLVFPISSRVVVFKEFADAIGLLMKTVQLQKKYLVRLESDDMFAVATRTDTHPGFGKADNHGRLNLTKEEKAAQALKATFDALSELAGKLDADLAFAKRDVAWGKLDAKDLSDMFKHFRDVYVPIMGMTTIVDIFKRVAEHRGWDTDEDDEDIICEKEREKRLWNQVMKQMHEPFEILSEAISQGLEHAGILLELLPRPNVGKKAGSGDTDVEAEADNTKPGDPGFAAVVDDKIQQFNSRKGELLKAWLRERALASQEDETNGIEPKHSDERRERQQNQLHIVLYMESLMCSAGRAVQELITYAESKVADGTMSRKRLIFPSSHRLRKWLYSVLSSEDSSAEQAPDLMESHANIVYFGDGYNKKKDPEHLEPVTAWERFGSRLRSVSNLLGSEESVFGFRVACATMTIGIVAFLENTQHFFMEQRLLWAMIIIAIGMTMTSGQSFFGFLLRVGGTVFGMATSLVIWYIVAEHRAGVIVFLWLFIFVEFYFFLKYFRFIPAVIIVIITQVLIVGYELQVLTLGVDVAERTGQPYYKIYLLAPYRLACVAGGSVVAFFWTIFPKPLTDRTWLRRDLSATLYLMANYFGVINSTLEASVDRTAGDITTPHTPAHQLHKAGRKIFGKVMLLIPSMSQHSEWQKWEPTIGGKFPREAYDDIILRSTRIMRYLTLVSYSLTHPTHDLAAQTPADEKQAPSPDDGSENNDPKRASTNQPEAQVDRDWVKALHTALHALKPTHNAILSTLTLLSNSLLSGQSLPPYVPLPRPYEATRNLRNTRLRKNSPDSAPPSPSSPTDDIIPDRAPVVELVSTNGAKEKKGEEDEDEEYELEDESHEGRRDRLPPSAYIFDSELIEQPGYAEFTVLQVCTTLVCDDLEGLVKTVSGLVGVVDFTIRVGGSGTTLGSAMSRGKGKVE
ncbi:hypothetical protein B0T16DRAFT_429608 [Cercophora newfieldiana]|uniref:ER transporter 6TM N-terminal domain-containing protein n=1 Tax=Cercophora newfieldiana TaxID=92897 RepID=A0AA39Y6J5_9PEZI|nr:hypothetical protein B0T16DRAFT_429608 [Cercophora newfieldiana]